MKNVSFQKEPVAVFNGLSNACLPLHRSRVASLIKTFLYIPVSYNKYRIKISVYTKNCIKYLVIHNQGKRKKSKKKIKLSLFLTTVQLGEERKTRMKKKTHSLGKYRVSKRLFLNTVD